MSQENVELVRRCAQFWIERDLSLLPQLVDPEVEIDLSRNVFNPDIYRGYEGVRRWVEGVEEMWDRFEGKIEEVIDAGENVVTAARLSGVGRDGIEVDMRIFQVWNIRNGKVLRVTGGYRARAEALEAAGLSE